MFLAHFSRFKKASMSPGIVRAIRSISSAYARICTVLKKDGSSSLNARILNDLFQGYIKEEAGKCKKTTVNNKNSPRTNSRAFTVKYKEEKVHNMSNSFT
jgi:hypothetical protein